jgi:hypothetical protein
LPEAPLSIFIVCLAALELALFFRVYKTQPPSTHRWHLSWGFGPLQRHQHWKPGDLGFASPDTFRLQGFAPSCRLSSSSTFRPCFMPVPLLGFSLQGFSPSQSFRFLSDAMTLLTLAASLRTVGEPTMRFGGSLVSRAFFSARIRHLSMRGEPHQKAAALLVFRP